MKTLKQLFIYSLFMLFLTNGSCVKPKIPTGDHTFSCYINGDLFLPKGSGNYTTPGPVSDGLVLIRQEFFLKLRLERFTKYTNYPNTLALRKVIAEKVIEANAFCF